MNSMMMMHDALDQNAGASIPVMNKPTTDINMMKSGPNGNNFQAAARQKHPVEELQQREARRRFMIGSTAEEEQVRHLYGTGFAMKLATERRTAMQHELASSVPGIPSSNMMSDILSGNDMTIGFEDVLSQPEHRPFLASNNQQHYNDPHSYMERTLGM